MYEGVFETEFSEKFETFKKKIPQHIAELIDDAIGWLVMDLDDEDLNRIDDKHFVWKKPTHVNCPEFYVLFKLEKEEGKVYILDFYDWESLDDAIFLDL